LELVNLGRVNVYTMRALQSVTDNWFPYKQSWF